MSKDDRELAMSLSHQESNDDDWELFVPVKGCLYPSVYQIKHHGGDWIDGLCGLEVISNTTGAVYRKPKQKENKMPDRTPQQALKDAIESGAVDAWINGEEIQARKCSSTWADYEEETPLFWGTPLWWRPKPPEPTKINWRPVVTGKEPKGVVMGYWGPLAIRTTQYYVDRYWGCPETQIEYATPTHWAPMCNLPEGDK